MEPKTFKEALIDAWDALIPLVGINFVWVISTLLVVTAFPGYAGVQYATNQIAHGDYIGFRDFMDGIKKYFWVSWKYGLLNLVMYFLIALNLRFYSEFEGIGYTLLQGFFLSFAILWTIVQMYVFPFILEQEEQSLKLAFRNSAAVCIRFMGRTFGLFAFFIVLAAVSSLIPPIWLLITVSFMIYLTNWQTIAMIRELKKLETAEGQQ